MMKGSRKVFRIEIKSAGAGDKWWNNKIGHIFDAYQSKHPCDPSVKGYVVEAFFIPAKHVEIANEIRDMEFLVKRSLIVKSRYAKKGYKTVSIYAFNVETNEEYYFNSMTEASLTLNIPRPTILKYTKLNKAYMGYYFSKEKTKN